MPAARFKPSHRFITVRSQVRQRAAVATRCVPACVPLGRPPTERRRTARPTVPTRGRSPRTATTDCSGCRRAHRARCPLQAKWFFASSRIWRNAPGRLETCARWGKGARIGSQYIQARPASSLWPCAATALSTPGTLGTPETSSVGRQRYHRDEPAFPRAAASFTARLQHRGKKARRGRPRAIKPPQDSI